MGVRYMIMALENWAHLPHNPRYMLIQMASFPLDANPEPKYWAGDEPLLRALGRVNPPATDRSPEAEAQRHANDVTLRKAIGQLVKAGAISYAARPVRGRRPEYWLHLGPQDFLAAYARESCSDRKEVLRGVQESLGAKEERGGERNNQGDRSPQVGTSPASSTGDHQPDDPSHDPEAELRRQQRELTQWERDHEWDAG